MSFTVFQTVIFPNIVSGLPGDHGGYVLLPDVTKKELKSESGIQATVGDNFRFPVWVTGLCLVLVREFVASTIFMFILGRIGPMMCFFNKELWKEGITMNMKK